MDGQTGECMAGEIEACMQPMDRKMTRWMNE